MNVGGAIALAATLALVTIGGVLAYNANKRSQLESEARIAKLMAEARQSQSGGDKRGPLGKVGDLLDAGKDIVEELFD